MKHRTIIPITALAAAFAVSAPHNAPAQQPPAATQAEKLDSLFFDHELISIDPAVIHADAQQSREITLTLQGVSFRFHITPRDLRSPRYRA